MLFELFLLFISMLLLWYFPSDQQKGHCQITRNRQTTRPKDRDTGVKSQGQRGTTGEHARSQEIGRQRFLLLDQRRKDPSSKACLGNARKYRSA